MRNLHLKFTGPGSQTIHLKLPNVNSYLKEPELKKAMQDLIDLKLLTDKNDALTLLKAVSATYEEVKEEVVFDLAKKV